MSRNGGVRKAKWQVHQRLAEGDEYEGRVKAEHKIGVNPEDDPLEMFSHFFDYTLLFRIVQPHCAWLLQMQCRPTSARSASPR